MSTQTESQPGGTAGRRGLPSHAPDNVRECTLLKKKPQYLAQFKMCISLYPYSSWASHDFLAVPCPPGAALTQLERARRACERLLLLWIIIK